MGLINFQNRNRFWHTYILLTLARNNPLQWEFYIYLPSTASHPLKIYESSRALLGATKLAGSMFSNIIAHSVCG
jgi:hypothetical protein